jgi:ribonuclease HI
MKRLIIYTDGGARGNPGPAGIGVIFYNDRREKLKELFQFIGKATNNQAEYTALILALKNAFGFKPQTIEVFLDSELAVKQLKGIYRVKDKKLKYLFNQVMSLVGKFKLVKFFHVGRKQNKEADRLVNKAINLVDKK